MRRDGLKEKGRHESVPSRKAHEVNSKNILQRNEDLRHMMEEDGESKMNILYSEAYLMIEDDVDALAKISGPASQVGQVPGLTAQVESTNESRPEGEVHSSAGQRRGRRKIMKKRTLKDEEGYLGEHRLVLTNCSVCSIDSCR